MFYFFKPTGVFHIDIVVSLTCTPKQFAPFFVDGILFSMFLAAFVARKNK
jgi:hypothetical protein